VWTRDEVRRSPVPPRPARARSPRNHGAAAEAIRAVSSPSPHALRPHRRGGPHDHTSLGRYPPVCLHAAWVAGVWGEPSPQVPPEARPNVGPAARVQGTRGTSQPWPEGAGGALWKIFGWIVSIGCCRATWRRLLGRTYPWNGERADRRITTRCAHRRAHGRARTQYKYRGLLVRGAHPAARRARHHRRPMAPAARRGGGSIDHGRPGARAHPGG